jgi:hypothetical protein
MARGASFDGATRRMLVGFAILARACTIALGRNFSAGGGRLERVRAAPRDEAVAAPWRV